MDELNISVITYIYIYIYIQRERERERESGGERNKRGPIINSSKTPHEMQQTEKLDL